MKQQLVLNLKLCTCKAQAPESKTVKIIKKINLLSSLDLLATKEQKQKEQKQAIEKNWKQAYFYKRFTFF